LPTTCRGLFVDNAAEAGMLVEIDRELQSIVPEYLVKRARDCAEIGHLLACGAMEDIKIMGHRMKGSGGSFGFDEISAIGEELEAAARNSNAGAVRIAAGRLRSYLERVAVTYI